MNLDDLVPVLQMAIGPVIVISGVGLLLLSMTNRYGRVIDRARSLADAARHVPAAASPARYSAQLTVLVRRARVLRTSVLLATTCLLLAAVLIIALFVTRLVGATDATAVVVIFLGCLGSLIASLVLFIVDFNLSLAALEVELGGDPPAA